MGSLCTLIITHWELTLCAEGTMPWRQAVQALGSRLEVWAPDSRSVQQDSLAWGDVLGCHTAVTHTLPLLYLDRQAPSPIMPVYGSMGWGAGGGST